MRFVYMMKFHSIIYITICLESASIQRYYYLVPLVVAKLVLDLTFIKQLTTTLASLLNRFIGEHSLLHGLYIVNTQYITCV